ncbi:MAG: hypothetical protein ABSA32_00385 [Candidatus Acidiferrales bacterium]|jgi:hypothetical protein
MSALVSAPVCDEQDFEEIESELGSGNDSRPELHVERIRQDQLAQFREEADAQVLQSDAQREDKARRWMWGFLISLAALQIYFVQAMLAALFLFALAFVFIAAIAVAFYAANRASQAGLSWFEPYARFTARVARRGYAIIEDLSRKTFRRLHSETAQ